MKTLTNESFNVLNTLMADGYNYVDMAKKLNKDGYTTATGLAISPKNISAIMLNNGVRVHKFKKRKLGKTKKSNITEHVIKSKAELDKILYGDQDYITIPRCEVFDPLAEFKTLVSNLVTYLPAEKAVNVIKALV